MKVAMVRQVAPVVTGATGVLAGHWRAMAVTAVWAVLVAPAVTAAAESEVPVSSGARVEAAEVVVPVVTAGLGARAETVVPRRTEPVVLTEMVESAATAATRAMEARAVRVPRTSSVMARAAEAAAMPVLTEVAARRGQLEPGAPAVALVPQGSMGMLAPQVMAVQGVMQPLL